MYYYYYCLTATLGSLPIVVVANQCNLCILKKNDRASCCMPMSVYLYDTLSRVTKKYGMNSRLLYMGTPRITFDKEPEKKAKK